MIKPITLIIPAKSNENKINYLLESIIKQTILPSEILLIDSNKIKYSNNKHLIKFFKLKKIKFRILKVKNLFPGAARNFGIKHSSNKILAFLDVDTIPSKNWLKKGFQLIINSNKKIVWGTTIYSAKNYFEKIVRASTYGSDMIKTIPGTILKKEVLDKIGLFVEHLRAGEDGDWIRRVKLHKIITTVNKDNIIYMGLNKITIYNLLKKWFRNYSISKNLGHLKNQKEIYYFCLVIIFLLIAFNWNAMIAGWNEEKNTYLPHITKISLGFTILIYSFTRGILIPLKKGVNLNFIFPLNFVSILILSVIIDITKFFAFILPKKN